MIYAVLFLTAGWTSRTWTATTGRTFTVFSAYNAPGRVATAEETTHSRHVAVLTIIAAPVALWAAMMRERYV